MDSVLSDGELSDYDLVSEISSSIADLHHIPGQAVYEPPPSQSARDTWETVKWDKEDVRAYVNKALEGSSFSSRPTESNGDGRCEERRTVRVYVDGSFEVFNAGHALQLRQAKLSFPTVHLIVGVFPDELISMCRVPHVERCELLRHCRWVDEVMQEVPLTVDEAFIQENRIDYVAVEEGISVDPAYDMVRVKAYDTLKKLGKVIPTRKTFGLQAPSPSGWPVLSPTTPVPRNSPFNEEEVHEKVDKYGIGF